MKLQTEIKLKKQDSHLIDYNSKMLLFGSCFSENIGNKLDYFKFQSVSNLFGLLFHPKAIENIVVRSIDEKEYSEEDLFFHNEQWHCFDAHSTLSNASKEIVLNELNQNLKFTKKLIAQSTHVVITLGTSWVYNHLKTKNIVANCHKLPQKEFKKELLQVDEIAKSLQKINKKIKEINTNVSIILTVSPVRHIKDGFVENTLSKAHLTTAIHYVLSLQKKKKDFFYFPSFEILIDQLRDYRFYGEDMLHPNQVAIDYVWEKFKEVWVALEAQKIMNDVEVIQKGLKHKPFNEDSQAHQEFLHKLNDKIEDVKNKFPLISF